VFAELWRGGADEGGVGRGRAEDGVRAQGRAAVIGTSQGEGEMVKEREEGALRGVKRRCLQSFGGVGLVREGWGEGGLRMG